MIEITSFAARDELYNIMFNRGYYMEPQPQGFKAYSLLRQVMSDAGKVAIAKITMQRREHLCALLPAPGMIELHTLYYADEVMPAGDLNIPRMELTKAEVETAATLVDNMTASFDPAAYHDEYHAALMKVIKAKLKGVEIPVARAPKIKPESDLLEALKASLTTPRKRPKTPA